MSKTLVIAEKPSVGRHERYAQGAAYVTRLEKQPLLPLGDPSLPEVP